MAKKKKTRKSSKIKSRRTVSKRIKKAAVSRKLVIRGLGKKKHVEEPEESIPIPVVKLPVAKKKEFRDMLLGLRERLAGQITTLKGDSLQRFDAANTEEDGTDAFERQFALNLVSSEQDALFEIDEALRRLDEGIYGVCLQCRKLIEFSRLKALPFVKMCVKCQSKNEKGKPGFRFDETVAYHTETPEQEEPADGSDSL
ncbi:MAG: TraR/DksA C4-type zinc finger protein [Kiritimatiellae bacterium]|nr:TraR/DksA C4-type zinc finger protein [Kiritimatiellia bacterium]MDD5522150.1 TraR/DksA C4-type zinc finger protein [Kiritimatiellia bacterium]